MNKTNPLDESPTNHMERIDGTLSAEEDLLLTQLHQKQRWNQTKKPWIGRKAENEREDLTSGTPTPPRRWETTIGLSLHDWQLAGIDAWFKNGMRGVIKVVTGAGKTVLALAIIEALQRRVNANLRVAIVVPTIVLLDQWANEFRSFSNFTPSNIGFVGAGRKGRFSETTRILICVLNSAARTLPAEVEAADVGENLLLIVDECHRAGAPKMKQLFQTRRAYSLGLSATPERYEQGEPDETFGQEMVNEDIEKIPAEYSYLQKELGGIVVEMNYDEAIRRDVLPPFRVIHYGLSLTPPELSRYEMLSRSIKDLRRQLETGTRKGLALIRWCRSRGAAREPRAGKLLSLIRERKGLLYRAESRTAAVMKILQDAFHSNPECKTILFHESIDEVMRIFEMLRQAGFPVVAEHSEFPDQLRARALGLFRKGTARVIVSARSLIEGFNVPSADIGIIVAASSSNRQRVQTLGRLLRKNKRPDGSEKVATLYTLYVSNTVDELIYKKCDWNTFIGAARNEYYLWQDIAHSDPIPRDSPPHLPLPSETSVNIADLSVGQPYPGDPDEGELYSLDLQKTIRDVNGNLIEPHSELAKILLDSGLSRRGGRFRVTPLRNFVTKLEKTPKGWQAMFLGKLISPIRMVMESSEKHTSDFKSGDLYPLSQVGGVQFNVLTRDKRLIARKTRAGIRFVKPAAEIANPLKRATLQHIQEQLAGLLANGRKISKLIVTRNGDVVYVFENQAFFLGKAPEGALGFEIEDPKMESK